MTLFCFLFTSKHGFAVASKCATEVIHPPAQQFCTGVFLISHKTNDIFLLFENIEPDKPSQPTLTALCHPVQGLHWTHGAGIARPMVGCPCRVDCVHCNDRVESMPSAVRKPGSQNGFAPRNT